MAVSMYSSGNRADFMISDANLPQRLEQLGKLEDAQTAQFAKILNEFGGNGTAVETETLTVESNAPAADFTEFDTLPDDPMALARMILKGDVKVEEVPKDKLTYDLLKAIVVLKKYAEGDAEATEEDEEKSEDTVFDPAKAAVLQQNFSMTLEDMIVMAIYDVIEKHNEREAEDKVTMLDGISEPIPEGETLPFPVESEQDNAADDSVFAQIVENHVDAVAEEQARENRDTFVSSESDENAQSLFEVSDNTQTDDVSKVLGEAVKNGEIGEVKETKTTEQPVVVKNDGEAAEKSVKAMKGVKEDGAANAVGREAAKTDDVAQKSDRAKAISEELEMLKNAKQKPETEQKPQDDVGKTSILQPNISESQMIFKKDNGEFLVVSQKEFTSQVMKLVEEAVKENKENTEYSLMLNPEELGKITVKLTKAADGAVSVTIMAENARTQRLLEQHSELMQSNLKNNGVQLESWQTVRESQQETLAQDYNGSSKNPYYREDNKKSDDDEEERSFADIIAAM